MTLVLTEGFETAQATSNLPKWTSVTQGSIAATPRLAGSGRSFAHTGGATTLLKDLGAGEDATVVVGLGIRLQNTGGASTDVIRLLGDAGATEHVVLRFVAGGNIAVDRGATQIAITTDAPLNVFGTTSWFYLEMKAVLHDTTGLVEVRINGATHSELTFSGDTKNGGTETVFDAVRIQYINSNTSYYDDIYILTGAGSAPYNDFIGDIGCYAVRPNGNGNSSQLVGSDGNSTDNYLLLDETTISATDYVGSATVDNKDTYAYPDITPTTGTVIGVTVASYALKSDAGAKSARTVVRSGGTDYAGSDVALSTGMTKMEDVYATDPATATTWTISGVNSAEFGWQVRA